MGALTSKPFSFSARSWELTDRYTYDTTDTFFSKIKISFRGNSIIRILPAIDDSNLSEWISDRARFSYDSFSSKNSAKFDSFKNCFQGLVSSEFSRFLFKRFFVGSYFTDYLTALKLRAISSFLGRSLPSSTINFDFRKSFFTNLSSDLLHSKFDNYFTFGLSLRYQLPVFSIQLRKQSTLPGKFFFNFGFFANNLFGELNFGFSIKSIFQLFRAKSRVCKFFFSDTAVAIANVYVHPLILAVKTKQVYVFFDSPSSVVSADIFSNPAIAASNLKLQLYKPHPFEYDSVYPKNASFYLCPSPLKIFSQEFGITTIGLKFAEISIIYTNFKISNFNKSVFTFDNFYTHYSPSCFLGSSYTTLALKRQIDYKNNFNLYL